MATFRIYKRRKALPHKVPVFSGDIFEPEQPSQVRQLRASIVYIPETKLLSDANQYDEFHTLL